MKRFLSSPLFIILIIFIGFEIVNGEFSDPLQWFIEKLLLLPAIIIGLSFHEFSHGLASHLLGDPTPKLQGRLSLNPFKHFDIFGFLCLLLAGFGWGIPVEIDPRYYKHPRRDELIVSLAGVTMNFILAVIFTFVLKFIFLNNPNFGSYGASEYILEIIVNIILINIVLMIFNLLPVPPLDGFGVITQLFNLRKYSWYNGVYEKGFAILMILVIFNIIDKVITLPITHIYNWLISTIIF